MKYIIKAFVIHMAKTYKNKLAALVMIAAGLIVEWLSDDSTFLIFALTAGIPLFLAKRNWMYEEHN